MSYTRVVGTHSASFPIGFAYRRHPLHGPSSQSKAGFRLFWGCTGRIPPINRLCLCPPKMNSEGKSPLKLPACCFCVKQLLPWHPPHRSPTGENLFSPERRFPEWTPPQAQPVGKETQGNPTWSGRRDSDSRPPPWQGGALPTELLPQIGGDGADEET